MEFQCEDGGVFSARMQSIIRCNESRRQRMEREEFINAYASKLSEQQLAGVTATERAVLLLAVPGSGKTTVLVTRLGYLLMVRGIRPENILTLTYTVSATKKRS